MKKIVLALFAAAAMFFGLTGCSGDLHDGPATVVLTVPASNATFAGSVITLTNVGGNGLKVDGSFFSWDGGSSTELTGFGPEYQLTTNGHNTASWIAEQSPFTGNYPDGADSTAKLKFGAEEGFICFKKGGTYTFDWTTRK